MNKRKILAIHAYVVGSILYVWVMLDCLRWVIAGVSDDLHRQMVILLFVGLIVTPIFTTVSTLVDYVYREDQQ